VATMATRSEPAGGLACPEPECDQERAASVGQSRAPHARALADAEDAVQETYARWCAETRREQDAIEAPRPS
jgi:hypothetical protein